MNWCKRPFPTASRYSSKSRGSNDTLFLGGNDDIAYVLLDGNERPGFNVIIPAIRHQILDSLPSTWKPLYLIEDQYRLTDRHIPYSCQCLQFLKELVHIIKIINEQVFNRRTCLAEIDYDVTFVLILCKRFDKETLPDTTRAFHQDCSGSVGRLLPIQ